MAKKKPAGLCCRLYYCLLIYMTASPQSLCFFSVVIVGVVFILDVPIINLKNVNIFDFKVKALLTNK